MPLSFSLACALSLYTHVVFHTGFCFPLMEFWRQSRRSHSVSFHHELRVGANAFTQTTTPPHQTLPMPREKERKKTGTGWESLTKEYCKRGRRNLKMGVLFFPDKLQKTTDEIDPRYFIFFYFGEETTLEQIGIGVIFLRQHVLILGTQKGLHLFFFFNHLPRTYEDRMVIKIQRTIHSVGLPLRMAIFSPGVHHVGVEHMPCCQSTVSEKCQQTAD